VGAYAVTAGTAALVAVAFALAARTSRSDALIVGSVFSYLWLVLLMLWCFADLLVTLSEVVDFEPFRYRLEKALKRSDGAKGG
jgi:hypothetical protein